MTIDIPIVEFIDKVNPFVKQALQLPSVNFKVDVRVRDVGFWKPKIEIFVRLESIPTNQKEIEGNTTEV